MFGVNTGVQGCRSSERRNIFRAVGTTPLRASLPKYSLLPVGSSVDQFLVIDAEPLLADDDLLPIFARIPSTPLTY